MCVCVCMYICIYMYTYIYIHICVYMYIYFIGLTRIKSDLHALVVVVGGRARLGEHAGGVEDVEPLVLHGAHVEVVHLKPNEIIHN